MTTANPRPRPGSGSRPGSRPRGVAHLLGPLVAAFLNGVLPVRLRAWDGSEIGPNDAPRVTVRDRDALRHVLARPGELGLSRAYVTGGIEVEGDLTDALRHVWASVEEYGTSVPGPRDWARAARLALVLGVVGPPLPPPVTEARMGGRLHSKERDAAAISHHYDAGNDLYELLLDETMAYSCALWDEGDPDQSLADAQRAKLDLICEKLRLGKGDRLLDVGCGWGSLTLHAARWYGARVAAVTLSARQRDHVRKRAAEEGLEQLVDVRLLHYRDIEPDTFGPGLFDAAASVEMGEHVGRDAYAPFVRQLHDLIRPGGSLLVQQMSRRGAYPGGGPFIERYIAPDMHMRPLGETVGLLEEAGLEVRGVQAMREHYVRTARAWSDVLERRFDEMVSITGPQAARVWRLYLAGGALAFEEGRMGVDQILAHRPGPHPDGWASRPAEQPELTEVTG
ncbi:SAM-dependent methyltransferase [Nocardiopsis valliformis]|uniref:SAM-dependent methyltransferase n=1 Tax=Nocardiopsis valliformis TaxID=239974 RepID=UPI000348A00D|nr:cyclopropane-fatty-acyl-phospholipid synthase family protein [Nocardiopsis valliformis]